MQVQTTKTGDLIKIPRHLAIIMDGNGRWAQALGKTRVSGHKKGADAVYKIVKHSAILGIKELTLFAFSSENWKRPQAEVKALMELFSFALKKWTNELGQNNIRIKVIGDLSRFSKSLQETILESEEYTKDNDAMLLNIAANYGGRWDVVQAIKSCLHDVKDNGLEIESIDENFVTSKLSTPSDVDLLIRTGGERRISNFLLWQCAYSEIYVIDKMWPDFAEDDLDLALQYYATRQRRFGMISEQIKELENGH